MKRTDMVREGTDLLVHAENAVETALSEVAMLACQLGKMRVGSNLSAVLGQDAMSEVADAISLLTGARGAMVRAHGHLDEVKTRIGCGAVSGGSLVDKGDKDTPVVPQTGIRQVA